MDIADRAIWKVFFAPVQSGTGLLVIDLGIQISRRGPSFLWHLFSLPAEFLFTILGTLMLFLPIIANVKKLAAGIQSVKEGDLAARVDVPLDRPVGKLAGAFNEMAERVQSMLNQHRHLIRAVAHEVRTPVSRIRFHLEMLTGNDGLPEAGRVKDILEEIQELSLLASELQTFTVLDSPDEGLEKASIPLHDVLSEIVAYFRKTQGALSFILPGPAERGMTVSAHPVYFRK